MGTEERQRKVNVEHAKKVQEGRPKQDGSAKQQSDGGKTK